MAQPSDYIVQQEDLRMPNKGIKKQQYKEADESKILR